MFLVWMKVRPASDLASRDAVSRLALVIMPDIPGGVCRRSPGAPSKTRDLVQEQACGNRIKAAMKEEVGAGLDNKERPWRCQCNREPSSLECPTR